MRIICVRKEEEYNMIWDDKRFQESKNVHPGEKRKTKHNFFHTRFRKCTGKKNLKHQYTSVRINHWWFKRDAKHLSRTFRNTMLFHRYLLHNNWIFRRWDVFLYQAHENRVSGNLSKSNRRYPTETSFMI